MKIGLFLGITCALLLHAGFILFGGLLLSTDKKDHGTLQEVDLLSDTSVEKEKDKPQEPPPEKVPEMETEQPPDAAEIIRNMETPAPDNAPALDAASLGAIEAALNGSGGGGDFASTLDFSSGGRIGGTGKAGAADEKMESAFSLAEIDQKPRPIYQGVPSYPLQMRGKKVEGVVTVIFIVDSAGKVINSRAEKSTDAAFEKPALDAVKRWKFEPAIKAGQRVACKMRVPIRFQPS